jgi:hypothetical protein
MNRSLRILMLTVAVLLLAACNREADTAVVEAPPVPAPGADADQMAWRAYLTDVVRRNAPDDVTQTYNYFLPASGGEDYEQVYARQLENVETALLRTIPPGNMLIFTSPEPDRVANLMVSAFEVAPERSLPGVYVLLIGNPDDEERVRPHVEATGASFIFVEMK